ncbi:hypothetical protein KL86DPRO_11716 [uncultured delta proteobacterium]|uniref:Uncharacterized protein n=1 Tax=uncultured delta proteobacterium TaxID=34034 RepID=A0A212JKW7_9DELT|nr:hypothetical protein KL86DPRO_11716 [uncultured delta proteobacterium]
MCYGPAIFLPVRIRAMFEFEQLKTHGRHGGSPFCLEAFLKKIIILINYLKIVFFSQCGTLLAIIKAT